MHDMFSADRRNAEVVNTIIALSKEAAGLTNRMAKETDADFIHLTQQKLVMAKCKLEEKTKEFEQEISADLHNRFCGFSRTFGCPAFDLSFVAEDGPV
jgi:hypothetical protein